VAERDAIIKVEYNAVKYAFGRENHKEPVGFCDKMSSLGERFESEHRSEMALDGPTLGNEEARMFPRVTQGRGIPIQCSVS
jgi:hypothetical protein